ncbi:NTF2 fold immunity protein [Akkermansia sp. N21169]|uniref:NTF2 fold immunity protein n=1 Tax=Akkermansia sp. N21169 TaxID=3040765 RepID=UPI00244E9620|nr:NTF2 fold immunity protein [Akkermansia sp. N21169]MDH3069428.1 NTF2 fold immunity protein [Akkermansia sp. N21169]
MDQWEIFSCCLAAVCLGGVVSRSEGAEEHGNRAATTERKPVVRNLNLREKTAVKLAEVILESVYGENVLNQRPWNVTDLGESFRIVGTFHGDGVGGVAEIVINKADGKVISYTHGK